MPPSRVDRTAALVLFVAVCAAYFNVFAGSLPLDEDAFVARDPATASLSGWLAVQPDARPLLTLSYALNHAAGLGTAGWQAVNVAIHTVASLLVYAVLRRLTHREDIVFRDQRLAAFLAAVLFALHPVQTEAVTEIAGRSTSLAAMFALLALLLWLRGREYDDRRDLYLRSPLAFVAALLCNGYVVVLPLALLLAARLQSHRNWWVRIALRESALHWLIAAVVAGAAFALAHYRGLVLGVFSTGDPTTELLVRAQTIARLALQLVRPERFGLEGTAPAAAPIDAASATAVAAVLLSLAAGLASLRRYPVLAFAILWFLSWSVSPVLLDPRAATAEGPQPYLALIGPALGTARLLLRLSPRVLQWALVPVVVAGLAFATHQRNRSHSDAVAQRHHPAPAQHTSALPLKPSRLG